MKLSVLFLMVTFLISAVPALASVAIVKNCAEVETNQNHPEFAIVKSVKPLAYFKGRQKQIALDQAKRASEILGAESFDLQNDFKYKLTFLGINYDAVNIDLGGNGSTAVFLENTTEDTNITFVDGDLYVDNVRCRNVTMPGDSQF